MTTTITITPAHLGTTATIADATLVAERATALLPDDWRAVAAEHGAPWGELPDAVELAVGRAIDSVEIWPSEAAAAREAAR